MGSSRLLAQDANRVCQTRQSQPKKNKKFFFLGLHLAPRLRSSGGTMVKTTYDCRPPYRLAVCTVGLLSPSTVVGYEGTDHDYRAGGVRVAFSPSPASVCGTMWKVMSRFTSDTTSGDIAATCCRQSMGRGEGGGE